MYRCSANSCPQQLTSLPTVVFVCLLPLFNKYLLLNQSLIRSDLVTKCIEYLNDDRRWTILTGHQRSKSAKKNLSHCRNERESKEREREEKNEREHERWERKEKFVYADHHYFCMRSDTLVRVRFDWRRTFNSFLLIEDDGNPKTSSSTLQSDCRQQRCSPRFSSLFDANWYGFVFIRRVDFSSLLVEPPEIEEVEEALVSLCQIHVQYLGAEFPDDRTILSVLAQLKAFDFKIGQPVWGPTETLVYLCEHRLNSGVKQTKIDQELHRIVKSLALPSTRVSWTCA